MEVFFSFFIETLTQRMFIQQLNLDRKLTTNKSKSKCIRDIIKKDSEYIFLAILSLLYIKLKDFTN